jgi:hypothetical protein
MTSEILLNSAITGGVSSIVMYFICSTFIDKYADNWWDKHLAGLFIFSLAITFMFFIAWVWAT